MHLHLELFLVSVHWLNVGYCFCLRRSVNLQRLLVVVVPTLSGFPETRRYIAGLKNSSGGGNVSTNDFLTF